MKAQLIKLLEVKTLITLPLTATFITLALRGLISAEIFMMVFMTIMTYFFTRKKDGA